MRRGFHYTLSLTQKCFISVHHASVCVYILYVCVDACLVTFILACKVQTEHFIYTVPFGISTFFFLYEINTFIQQGRIKLIKSDSKNIHNVTIDLYFK